jgi:hypothetical protein
MQLNQRRQKPRKRFAATSWSDQQHRASAFRLCQQFELMRTRPPATAGEPAREDFRQKFCLRLFKQ